MKPTLHEISVAFDRIFRIAEELPREKIYSLESIAARASLEIDITEYVCTVLADLNYMYETDEGFGVPNE